MNIREDILQEKIYSKTDALRISEYACSSKNNFEELMQCFLNNEDRLAQRAAWTVSLAVKKNKIIIEPYIEILANQLGRKDVHDALIRNSVRILEAIEIPAALHGQVMNSCFEYIENPLTPIAIKAFSLTTLYNLSKVYKEIRPELKTIIETLYDNDLRLLRAEQKKF